MWFFGILAFTFITSLLGTWIVRIVTHKKGWVAHPKEDRWHTTPTALHGGVGIYTSFLLGSLLFVWAMLKGWIGFEQTGEMLDLHILRRLIVILGGVSIVFVIGLVDDILQLKPGVKLLGQLVAVSLAIFLGIGYNLTPYPFFDILLSYLWFVGIINAINLLDNMDGVSSGVVIIGGGGVVLLALIGYSDVTPVSAYLGSLLIAASFGFWLQNKPPAKIFMGDSGSLVLGFIFATITIPSDFNAYYVPDIDFSIWDKILQLLVAVTLAAIPILDTTLVTITRLMRGQSPSVGGKDHSTHRIAKSGLTQWQTLKFLYGVSLVCVLIAVVMVKYPSIGFLVFGGAFVSLSIVAVYLASVRIQVDPIKKEGWQQLVTSITYRIPLIKMVLDVLLIGMSFHFAYLIRFDFNPDFNMTQAMLKAMPIVVVCCLISNFSFRIYDFSWRSASSRDILNYAGTAVIGTILSLAVVTLVTTFSVGFSRGAFVIFSIVYFLVLSGSRYSYRFIDDLFLRFRLQQTRESKIPVLIFGSTRETKSLLDEIQHDTEKWSVYRIIGIVETTEVLGGRKLLGIPVKSANAWLQENFETDPELLVTDDSVSDQDVKKFGNALGQDIRLRRYRRQISEIF